MRHLPTIFRQVRRSSKQAGFFVLCVALSLTALTAFSGFARTVELALEKDAQSLHGADIIIQSPDAISDDMNRAINGLAGQGQILRVNVHEFYSVVLAADETASVLSMIKAVSTGYPFYGQVILESGGKFDQKLTPGTCIVAKNLLERTGLRIGDMVKVGYAKLKIADVVTNEPDRPLELFTLGPRVFVHDADLASLGLLATGSRIRRKVLIKIMDSKRVDAVAAQLQETAALSGERVDTFRTASSAVKRFFDNFLFFLKLVGLFILAVSGIGIQSTLTAFFNENQSTVAIMKTVGAGIRYIMTHFLFMVFLLAALAAIVGIVAGMAVQGVLLWRLSAMLPGQVSWTFSLGGVTEALAMGGGIVLLFSALPLYRLGQMRPIAILYRRPPVRTRRWPATIAAVSIALFFLGLVAWHMADIRFGVLFVGTMGGMILLSASMAQLALAITKRLSIRNLALRQAARGLFRRGNATRTVLITLTVSISVIFGVLLLERNLAATFVHAFPADTPNVYFVDVQPSQVEAFQRVVGRPARFYPVIRARITAVNGQRIEHQKERKKRRDNLSRVFNLTYRKNLLADETLIEGETLFRKEWTEPQVSIMDTIVSMHPMKIGDRIQFKIQGVPLTARIASIRSREKQSFSPFFYFVFPTSVLEKAPQTLFCAIEIPPGQFGLLQNKVVGQFPNVSVIDLSQTIGTMVRLLERLSRIMFVFAFFSVAAGMLILASSVFATRAERIAESAYYKILGADLRFVWTVFALENVLIGLMGGLLGLAMAQAIAYWICTARFDIGYRPFISTSAVMVGFTIMVVVAVGLGASRSIMAKKPVTYLRKQQDG